MKMWSKTFEEKQKVCLVDIDGKIDDIFISNVSGPLSHDYLASLQSFESSKWEILACEEELWQEKSRATWMEASDNNTIFFIISEMPKR